MSYTQDKIKRTEQAINRLSDQLVKEKIKERKQETRRKIELGGLVVKAQMDHLPKSVILGALLTANFELENDVNTYDLYKKKGDASFNKNT